MLLQLCPTLCDPMDCSPLGSSVHGILQVRILEWVAMPSSRGSSWPRDGTLSPVSGSLPLVPLGSPSSVVCESRSVMSDSSWPHGLYSPWNSPGHNTRVGISSLLQGIFPTQGSNPGLLHYRWILYQLSHQGSPSTQQTFSIKFTNRLCGQYKGSATYYSSFFFFKIYLFISGCAWTPLLCAGFLQLQGAGGCSSFQCTGFSLWLLLQRMGSRAQASVVVAPGL